MNEKEKVGVFVEWLLDKHLPFISEEVMLRRMDEMTFGKKRAKELSAERVEDYMKDE